MRSLLRGANWKRAVCQLNFSLDPVFRFNVFEGCSKAHSCTLILRGGAEQFIAETERSLHDAIMIVRRAKKNDSIVAGGGAIEMELSKHLREVSKTITNKEQFFWRAFAKSFEVIPQQVRYGFGRLKSFQLCFNAGMDGVDILNQLRARHQKGNKWDGVDIHKEEVRNNFDGCVWEPALTKEVSDHGIRCRRSTHSLECHHFGDRSCLHYSEHRSNCEESASKERNLWCPTGSSSSTLNTRLFHV